ncbi:MAG: permease [Kiritimatiellae bacterium]|nr:permease [Kiritimatiellia bacterium]
MSFLASLWGVLAQMAPWLLGGFLLAGIISELMPAKWVASVMGGARGLRGVLNAVLIGIPLPICSCGVLPLAAGLRKAGAGRGAVAGFLVATPQTGVDSILATYAMLGPAFALARPVAALATGLAGGVAADFAGGRDADPHPAEEKPKCCCCGCHKVASVQPAERPVFVRIIRKAYLDLLGEIARPLAVGLAIAAAVAVFVPEDFFTTAFCGGDWIQMPLMILVGFPMYVCSIGSIPIAASLMAKGLSPGAAFVFLMVGPAINAASVTTSAALIGRRATAAYAATIVAGALLCGIAVNALPAGFLPHIASQSSVGHTSPIGHLAAAALVALMLFHLARTFLPAHKPRNSEA